MTLTLVPDNVVQLPVKESAPLTYLQMVSQLNKIGKKSQQKYYVAWEDIYFDPADNIRTEYGELSRFDSMDTNQIHPIIGFIGTDGKFHPRDGFGRLLWMKARLEAGFTLNPIEVELNFESSTELGAIDLMLNSANGKELTMHEKGIGYQRYKDQKGLTNTQIAERVKRTVAHVGQCLNLVNGSSDFVAQAVTDGHIAATEVGKIIASLPVEEAEILITELVETAKTTGKKATGKVIKEAREKREQKPKETKVIDTTVTDMNVANVPSQLSEGDETQEHESIARSLGDMGAIDWEELDLGKLRMIFSILHD